MVLKLSFDAEAAKIGQASRVVLTETDLAELVRMQYTNDRRVVTLVPEDGSRALRFKWISGEHCEFSFTPRVLSYKLRITTQRGGTLVAEFQLAIASSPQRVIVPRALLDIDWRLSPMLIRLEKAAVEAARMPDEYWDLKLLELARKHELTQVDPAILKLLRVDQVYALTGSRCGETRLPDDVLGIICRELLRTPPKLMGELPLQFVRSQPSLGYSGLLNKLAARVGL